MSSLEAVLRKRTRIIKELESQNELASLLTSSESLILIKERAKLLENSYAEHIKTNERLENMDGADFEASFDENRKIEEECLKVRVHLLEIIDQRTKEIATNTGADNNKDEDDVTQIKLPPVDIRPFDGASENWLPFRDLFVALIHEKKGMKPVEKMHYLKSYVSGEAADYIKHITITTENYLIAWKRLEDRYHNARLLVDVHIGKIINQPNVPSKNAIALRKLIDVTNENLHMISALGASISSWDPIIIFVLMQKLDAGTQQAWKERLKASKDLVNLGEFVEFIETRSRVIEEIKAPYQEQKESKKENQRDSQMESQKSKQSQRAFHARTYTCPFCTEAHGPFLCPTFLKVDETIRLKMVHEKKCCLNCLFPHLTEECKSKYTCKLCHKKHNVLLLHNVMTIQDNSVRANLVIEDSEVFIGSIVSVGNVLLATACVPVFNKQGKPCYLRALLDQGSQVNIISEAACQLLNLNRSQASVPLLGIGNTPAGIIEHMAEVIMGSRIDPTFRQIFSALVMQNITKVRPSITKAVCQWAHLQGLELADKQFHIPGRIDLLLGASVYANVIGSGLIKGPCGTPIAQESKLGWFLSGSINDNQCIANSCHYAVPADLTNEDTQIAKQLKRFWEIEELHPIRKWTQEEERCEEFFVKNIRRDSIGRYIVPLPFKEDCNAKNFLGDSKNAASNRLFGLERRFQRNPNLQIEYTKVIQEYIDLGHLIELCPEQDETGGQSYYIPHHVIFKETSTTTKVRVVFDASCATTNSFSLNDRLMVGPTIQDTLFNILVRWRSHKIVFTADIEKMYRQFNILPEHQCFQKILWRFNATDPIKTYALTTVTFGVASAPFQAVRSLRQLAKDEVVDFPLAAQIIEDDAYVDDVVSGTDTVEEAIDSQQQLNSMLDRGQLPLKKWTSNSRQLLESIPEAYREVHDLLEISKDDTIKALGIWWHPKDDNFRFKINLGPIKSPTKRSILSDASKLFDPFGWLAPTIVSAKILLQHIWITGLNWDEPLPNDLTEKWILLRSELAELEQLRIPRWLKTFHKNTDHRYELHGFSDASEMAYAATIYLRVIFPDGRFNVQLVAAKTKVAPIKKISLPRLELCGANLLTNLMVTIKETLKLKVDAIINWTDSTIVLAWIRGHPIRWKTYVANRITEIQGVFPSNFWRHVPSQKNPADHATRGLSPKQLIECKIWWAGPEFLWENEEKWPIVKKPVELETVEDMRGPVALSINLKEVKNPILHRFSTIRKLLHVTAYLLRFKSYKVNKENDPQVKKLLTVQEVNAALLCWVRYVQKLYYPNELKALTNKRAIDIKSKILSLHPILDEEKIIRVGGRLSKSVLTYDQKHPILLPNTGHLTKLIIHFYHDRMMHGGTQLTLNSIRQKFWIVHGRNTVRLFIRNCVRCARFASKPAQQFMADLPTARVNHSRPFSHSGVDYAGPIKIRSSHLKKAPILKGYIAIFVCFCTKAIHLELASDLTSETFIAAFRRFAARRGLPSNMYSDNGKNFEGAEKEIARLLEQSTSVGNKHIRHELLKDNIQWHFNPPSAPHFGGLWEAGVKSVKHHLKRVLGETSLTFEAMNTVLSQIEACLNSRPICPLSSDATDLEALTPGHFLIGGPLTAMPEPNLLDLNIHRLDRWQFIQRLLQHFWDRWHHEYLHGLQGRTKWQKIEENIVLGEFVLIKEDNLPPTKWLMGRIISTFPDQQGFVRKAEVKTAESTFVRPIQKLCRLPIVDNSVPAFDNSK